MNDKLELLRSVPLFSGLGHREIERLSELATEVDVPDDRLTDCSRPVSGGYDDAPPLNLPAELATPIRER